MSNSHHLQLPYIMPSQAQKHVTHNEAIRALDALVQLSVIEVGLLLPPFSPQEGERYIIGPQATGDWEDKDNLVAAFIDGAWMYFNPGEGWLAWDEKEQLLVVYAEGDWIVASSGDVSEVGFLGINGQANETERLVVNSGSILFNHEGNDHRLKVNKATSDDTASLLFQDAYSGRAEMGLVGSDAFTVKVSPDAVQWHDAITIDPLSGETEFPAAGITIDTSLVSNLLPDSGRFNHATQQHILTTSTATSPSYMTVFNGATFSFPFKFIHNNASFGGTLSALDPVMEALIVFIFGASGLRYGPEFWSLRVEAGTGTSSATVIDNETYYRSSIARSVPRPGKFTTGFFVRCETGKLALRQPISPVRRIMRNGIETAFGTQGVVVTPSDGWVYFEMQLIRANISYEQNDMSLNLLPNSMADFALPRIMPGWVSIGPNEAVVTNDRIFGN